MRIAQRFVAGEAVFRPPLPQTSPSADDQQALDDYACDRSNLPWVIFRAAHRATHISALPARARALLAALARTVDAARPYAPIFARRELLTGRAQQSMRTFYRGLDDLESAGFITRPPQTRYGQAGLFGRAYLHLTPKAAVLLGLIEPVSDAEKPSVERQDDTTQDEGSFSCDQPSVTVADGPIYKDLIPTTQKRQPGRLPADLKRLLSLGFREFLIFKLMREAKLHGKLLSDVVEASWNHLSRARHPISYVRSLLRAPVDFAYRVRSQRDANVEQQKKRARAERTDDTVRDLAGRTFISRDGLRQYHVSDDHRSITIHHRDESQPRVHAGAWAHDFVAALDAGHIVPITPNGGSEATPDADRRDAAFSANPSQRDDRTSASAPRFETQRNDLREILRLKRAGIVPTKRQGNEQRVRGRDTPNASPLSSLLQAISLAAAARGLGS